MRVFECVGIRVLFGRVPMSVVSVTYSWSAQSMPASKTQSYAILTLEVTTGPNSARAISADRAHGRNSAQFGMT